MHYNEESKKHYNLPPIWPEWIEFTGIEALPECIWEHLPSLINKLRLVPSTFPNIIKSIDA